jgi:hypothetical protein
VIERNVAIHQALTAYHRIFDDGDEEREITPLPFQSLIKHLHQLRNEISAGVPSPSPSPCDEATNSSQNVLQTSYSQSQQQRYIYQKEDIKFLQERREKSEMTPPACLLSYQNILHTRQEGGIQREKGGGNSSSFSKKKNQKKKFIETDISNRREQWGDPTSGVSLDNLLTAAVGNNHYVVTEENLVIKMRDVINTEIPTIPHEVGDLTGGVGGEE